MQPRAFSVFNNLTFDDKKSQSSASRKDEKVKYLCDVCGLTRALYLNTGQLYTRSKTDISLLSQLEQDVTTGHLRPSELSVF